MNTNFISKLIAVCLAMLLFISCEWQEKKTEDAFDRVKKEKMLSKNSDIVIEEFVQKPKKIILVKENKHLDEWTEFKIETENKILSNDKRIKEIKSIPNTSVKLLKKAAILEKQNNELKIQMSEYAEAVKLKWELFRASMKQDVNEIDKELKNMTLANKK